VLGVTISRAIARGQGGPQIASGEREVIGPPPVAVDTTVVTAS
jgi:hypothetical protein